RLPGLRVLRLRDVSPRGGRRAAPSRGPALGGARPPPRVADRRAPRGVGGRRPVLPRRQPDRDRARGIPRRRSRVRGPLRTVLDDVTDRLEVVTPPAPGGQEAPWRRHPLDLTVAGTATWRAPRLATIAVGAIDADTSDALWLTASGFLTPTTLSRLDLDADGA